MFRCAGVLLSQVGGFLILRYFLRATISRRLNDISKEMDIVVHTLSTYPELNSSIKMEVGIEDCLHIEFEYNKSKYVLLSCTVTTFINHLLLKCGSAAKC